MKLLRKYDDFLTEKLLKESIDEMNLVLSNRFLDLIKQIDSQITDEFLKCNNDIDFKTKQTFIDIKEGSDDMVTFIMSNKASEILNIDNQEEFDKDTNLKNFLKNDIDTNHDIYKTTVRTPIKLGRLINTIFPNKFVASARTNPGQKPNDVESYVNLYKVISTKDEKFKLFKLVKGDDISHYYDCDNYSNQSGSLGSSCMSSAHDDYFEIYTNNPDKVQMLILYSDNSENLIKGRAIVWKLDRPDNRIYMDRVYVNNYSDETLFIEYAKTQGWLFRAIQAYSTSGSIADPITKTNINTIVTINLKPSYYDYYPYMDTLMYYNPDTGLLSNNTRGCKYYLQSTSGDYETIRDYDDDDTVYSEYHGEDILRRDAQWCELGQDWVYSNEAIRVYNTGLGSDIYAIPGYEGIVKCYIPSLSIDKHFPKEKCTWSDHHNTWIFSSSAKNVYLDFDKTEYFIDHKNNENKTFFKKDNDYFDIKLK